MVRVARYFVKYCLFDMYYQLDTSQFECGQKVARPPKEPCAGCVPVFLRRHCEIEGAYPITTFLLRHIPVGIQGLVEGLFKDKHRLAPIGVFPLPPDVCLGDFDLLQGF